MTRLALALALIVTPAFAQQSPLERALSNKLTAEINASLACNVELIEIKMKLEQAQARIKELEAR